MICVYTIERESFFLPLDVWLELDLLEKTSSLLLSSCPVAPKQGFLVVIKLYCLLNLYLVCKHKHIYIYIKYVENQDM